LYHSNDNTIKNTFHKQERLCSKKQMEVLFKNGTSHNAYPVKLIYLVTPVDLQFPAQAMFVVPKRNFKRSPDRNLLKRRMREVYRLQKRFLYQELTAANKKCIIAFLYTGKKEEKYDVIELAIKKLLNKIMQP
jgi:ribonuclease P protein component